MSIQATSPHSTPADRTRMFGVRAAQAGSSSDNSSFSKELGQLEQSSEPSGPTPLQRLFSSPPAAAAPPAQPDMNRASSNSGPKMEPASDTPSETLETTSKRSLAAALEKAGFDPSRFEISYTEENFPNPFFVMVQKYLTVKTSDGREASVNALYSQESPWVAVMDVKNQLEVQKG